MAIKMTAVFIILLRVSPCVVGASRVICPKETIHAVIGGSVTLSARVDPSVNLKYAKVNVSKALTNEIVHLYRLGEDYLHQQSPQYKTRTTLNRAHLEEGNVTLDISNLTPDDSGLYRLTTYLEGSDKKLLRTGCDITLSVVDISSLTTPPPEIPTTVPLHQDLILKIVPPLAGLAGLVGLVVGYRWWKSRTTKTLGAESGPESPEMERLNQQPAERDGDAHNEENDLNV